MIIKFYKNVENWKISINTDVFDLKMYLEIFYNENENTYSCEVYKMESYKLNSSFSEGEISDSYVKSIEDYIFFDEKSFKDIESLKKHVFFEIEKKFKF